MEQSYKQFSVAEALADVGKGHKILRVGGKAEADHEWS